MRTSFFLLSLFIVFGCQNSFEANENLTIEQYNTALENIAPYVLKKPEDVPYENRFDAAQKDHYQKLMKYVKGELKYFKQTDTANVFHFSYRDFSSLYEHYRGLGGYYKTNADGKITFVNLLYFTPRFTLEEKAERDLQLFTEMVTKRNVKAYIGNRNYVQTPNDDFYYNTKLNRWDYTENSSWKILEEAKEKVN